MRFFLHLFKQLQVAAIKLPTGGRLVYQVLHFKKLDDALVTINGVRAELGAKQNRLSSASRSLEINDENISAANSRIRDVDIASETADLAKNNILVQSGISVLANHLPSADAEERASQMDRSIITNG